MMKITNNLLYFNIPKTRINSNNFSLPVSFSSRKIRENKPKDTFELSQKEFLKQDKEKIIEAIEASVKNKKNKIGSGCEGVVYRIEGTNYCVKVPYGSQDLKKANMTLKLRPKDKINHVVARFDNGVKIMEFIEGYSAQCLRNGKKCSDSSVKKLVLELPVNAFQKLLQQIAYAKKNNMIFDSTLSNVVVNPSQKTMTAIDFYEMQKYMPEDLKVLPAMMEALADDNNVEMRRKCLSKIILAALEELKPGVEPSLSIGDFRFRKFLESEEAIMPEIVKANWHKLKRDLTDIECLKIKEYAGLDITDEMNERIKIVQTLLNSY